MLRVIDLKQFEYCPRIIYYHQCLPRLRPMTAKMIAGIEAQESEQVREARRSLRPYGLKHGDRQTNVHLESSRLGLRGIIDLVIETNDNPDQKIELIPVDYKLSTRLNKQRHFKLQLAAYGLMLEEVFNHPVQRGFLYYLPLKQAVEVPLNTRLRNDVRRNVSQMHQIVEEELMPAPTRQRAKCRACEFRRFCNDV